MLPGTYYLHKLRGQEPILCINSGARNLLTAEMASQETYYAARNLLSA